MEWLKDRQPQANLFRAMIERAGSGQIELLMSVINLGEVYYSCAKDWGLPQADEILARIGQLPITLVSASDEEVLSAARLKAVHSISYADAFCASLAIGNGCRLITGDVEFRDLAVAGLQLEWLGA